MSGIHELNVHYFEIILNSYQITSKPIHRKCLTKIRQSEQAKENDTVLRDSSKYEVAY